MADYDAIIVGAGHNGLICAVYLLRAGWRVAVLEANEDVGGGLRSGAVTLPGFYHDRYATNLGAFASSPIYQELKSEFDTLGVKLLRSERTYAAVHGRRALRVYTDASRTEAEFPMPGDVAGWRSLSDLYKRVAPAVFPLFYTELPSAAMWTGALRLARTGLSDALQVGRLLVQSSREFAGAHFQSEPARSLIEAWAYHMDFGPDTRGGAAFGFIAALASYFSGMPLVEGGAGRITSALAAMIRSRGGMVRAGTKVVRIITKNGGAVAVRTENGEEISASRAIIASVTPPHLFGDLVDPSAVSAKFLRRAERFRYGPGTFIIHLALDRMPHWTAADDLGGFNYVHLNGAAEEIANTYAQSLSGFLPSRPLLVVSQTTPLDPSRAPEGRHVMRIHVRTVPRQIAGDAAGVITARDWQHAKGPFAERILDLVAEQAPDLRECILAMTIETPIDIERENSNFVGGDCVSGSHHIGQNFFFRPMLGWSRYTTPVPQLYMIGASTWPGGGINGGSGYLLAHKLLNGRNFRPG